MGNKWSVLIEDDQLLVDPYQGKSSLVEFPHSDPHDEMWGALGRSIAQNEPAGCPLAQAWGDLAVLFAVERSIKTGEKINLCAK